MSNPARILSVGALTLDTVYRLQRLPRSTGKFLADHAEVMAAGMASSAAVAAVRLGGKADIWASVGDDAAGRFLVNAMAEHQVGTIHIQTVTNAASAVATILVDAGGERIVIAHYSDRLIGNVDTEPFISAAEYDAVLVDVRWPKAAQTALVAAQNAGLPGVLDADVGDLDNLNKLAELASHIVASRDGAARLTGESNPHRALKKLLARFGCFVAVTSGGDGCYWADLSSGVQHTAASQIDVIDTNAAGDVFHGAFVLALAEGQPEDAAIVFASAAAEIKCTRFGGLLGAPNRIETEQLLARKRAT